MASDREPPTTTDYLVTALSPVLVMLMVGSLVFFLVEVLYAGKYSGRLLYTLFFFVAGAVLVARIAIETDAGRASLYGLMLGAVTYIALLAYVEYPGGGWLQSYRLARQSRPHAPDLVERAQTDLGLHPHRREAKRRGPGRAFRRRTVGGSGDRRRETEVRRQKTGKYRSPTQGEKEDEAKNPTRFPSLDWIERYKKQRDAKRKGPHTPGVWVIYFALAALPLFALGQSLIDVG